MLYAIPNPKGWHVSSDHNAPKVSQTHLIQAPHLVHLALIALPDTL